MHKNNYNIVVSEIESALDNCEVIVILKGLSNVLRNYYVDTFEKLTSYKKNKIYIIRLHSNERILFFSQRSKKVIYIYAYRG